MVSLIAALTIAAVLWEAFETVILPRRIQRKLRFTRLFYLATWTPWRRISRALPNGKIRESWLSFYGPLSLVALFATWAALLLVAFGVLQWGMGSGLRTADHEPITLAIDLYMSGTTLFTLGLGDVTPQTGPARLAAVVEAAIGFGLIALVLSYLPTVYQSFARREVNISLLDARAGSPPTAAEFRRRYGSNSTAPYLAGCEIWASELLESHMSYPALCYFRSQHANQSWVGGLTAMLDMCCLVEVSGDKQQHWQAKLTFAMARHAALDLMQVFHLQAATGIPDRLTPAALKILALSGEAEGRLRELCQTYEPSVQALARFLAMDLPPWIPPAYAHDNWRTDVDRTME